VTGKIEAAAALPPDKRASGTHWIEICMEPRIELNVVARRKVSDPVGNRNPVVHSVSSHFNDAS